MNSNKRIIEDIEDTFNAIGYPSDFLDAYDQLECLASTNGRETFLVRNKIDGFLAVAKCFDKEIYSFALKQDVLIHLDYPGIPKIFACYENEKMSCVVREYIDGVSLDEYIHNNELSEKEKINICIKLADILVYLHSQKKPIIHRDIKPGNVIVKANGDVALIDFDIARTIKEDSEVDTVFFGTKGFAPPEQYGFEQTSQRADIYAFGVLMRFLFTGSVVKNDEAIINKRIKHIINKCTAFSPRDRYANMMLVKEELLGKKLKKTIILSTLLMILFVCLTLFVHGSIRVKFKEPLIEQAVRLQLNMNDSQMIKKEDLANVKEIIICGTNAYEYSNELYTKNPRNTIKGTLNNLDDIKLLPNLEKLVISFQGDIDISGIVDAKNLNYVEFKHVNILDISPLSELENLEAIFIFGSGINECKQISGLPNVEHLDVGYTNINSFEQIGVFPKLKEISIKLLSMYTLDGIEKMQDIEVVWMNGIGVGDISALAKLPNLKAVHTDKKYIQAVSELLKDKNIDIIIEE